MSNPTRRIVLTLVILIAFAAMITGIFIAQHVHHEKTADLSEFHGTLLDKPREVTDFALAGTNGRPFTAGSLTGHWTMMFFGFTNCGSICPTTMAELNNMYQIMTNKGITPLPQVVMVSLDPKRDNLEKLTQYVKAYNPNFLGARGEDDSIRGLTKEFGVAYVGVARPNASSADDYQIDHSGTIMLFNPAGQLAGFFTMPHHANSLVEDYQILTQHVS